MRRPRMLQAVTGILIVAMATGCAASKEYSSKLFAPREESIKDSQAVTLRFLDLDRLEPKDEGWVDTKVIKDSVWKDPVSGSGEALANQQPASKPKKTEKAKTKVPDTEVEADPIVKTTPVNGTRNKTSRE